MKFRDWPYTDRLVTRMADSSLQDIGIASLKRPPRSAGLHASELLKKLHPKESEITEDELRIYGLLGLAFEDRAELALLSLSAEADWPWECYRPGEVTRDGIACSPDIMLIPKDEGQNRELSIKVTWKSTTDAPDGDKFQYYQCVVPDTLLTTHSLTQVTAGSVKKGDILLGFDESPDTGVRHLRPTKVEAVSRLKKPCSILTLVDGTTIITSEDHHWLCQTGKSAHWRQTAHVLSTDRFRPTGRTLLQNASLLQVHERFESCLTPLEQGYLAGLADGEGCLCQGPHGTLHLSLSQRPGLVLSKFQEMLTRDGFGWTTSRNHVSDVLVISLSTQQDIFRFLAVIRPVRLLAKYLSFERLSRFTTKPVQVLNRESVGIQEVVSIQTTTRTFVGEGFASHNSQCLTYCSPLQTLASVLLVYFVNGDYSFLKRGKGARPSKGKPPMPLVRGYELEFTPFERAEMWAAMLGLKRQGGY